MSPKQLAFAESYLRTNELKTAAKEAGITYGYARDLACGKKSPAVKEHIETELAKLSKEGTQEALSTREERILEFESLYQTSLAKGSFNSAIKALREACLLQGYYTHRIEAEGKMSMVDLIASIDPAELDGFR